MCYVLTYQTSLFQGGIVPLLRHFYEIATTLRHLNRIFY